MFNKFFSTGKTFLAMSQPSIPDSSFSSTIFSSRVSKLLLVTSFLMLLPTNLRSIFSRSSSVWASNQAMLTSKRMTTLRILCQLVVCPLPPRYNASSVLIFFPLIQHLIITRPLQILLPPVQARLRAVAVQEIPRTGPLPVL